MPKTQGSSEFDVFRLIQIQQGDQFYGSQSSSLNFAAAHFTGDVFRKVAVIHFNELFDNALQQIIQKKPMGILVVLPDPGSIHQTPDFTRQLKIWEEFQIQLTTSSIAVPVYFAFESKEVSALFEAVQQTTEPVEFTGRETPVG